MFKWKSRLSKPKESLSFLFHSWELFLLRPCSSPSLLEETTILWTYVWSFSEKMTQNLSSWMRPQFAIDFLPHCKTLSLSPMLNFISAAYLMLFLPTMVAVSGDYFPSSKWVIAPSKDRNGVFSFSAAQGSLLRMAVAHQCQCWLRYDSPKAFFGGSFLPWNTLLCQLDAVNVLSPHAPQPIGWHGHRKMGTPDCHCCLRKRGAAKVDGERHNRTTSARERELTKGIGKEL